jgi:midasin
MNQQSDSADLLGGFCPIELRLLCEPLKRKFDNLFAKTFSRTANRAFLEKVNEYYANKDWKRLILAFKKVIELLHKNWGLSIPSSAISTTTTPTTVSANVFQEENIGLQENQNEGQNITQPSPFSENRKRIQQSQTPENQAKKSKRELKPQLREKWKKFIASISKFEIQHQQIKNNFAFTFVEGALVKAIKKGYWVLLDEINLAPPETLEVMIPHIRPQKTICYQMSHTHSLF